IRATNAVSPRVQVEVIQSYALLVGGAGFHAAQHSNMVAFQSHAENGVDGFLADDLGGTNDTQAIFSNSEASYITNGVHAGTGANVQAGGVVVAFASACGFKGDGGAAGFVFFYSQTSRTFLPGAANTFCGSTQGIPQT
ncbi:MAG TPA: hypothetical protein VJA94_20285, partial [Candidatus Angelobacter sp.]